jgi:hypothetical protein
MASDTDRPDDTDEDPQASNFFLEPTEEDVHLDPDHPAFDRVQKDKEIDGEYEREYNRRYVKEHGDHHGHRGAAGRAADAEDDRQP